MVDEFPLLPLMLEFFKTGRFEVDVSRVDDRFVESVFA